MLLRDQKRDDFFFFKQKTAYEIRLSLVGSEMCIRDSTNVAFVGGSLIAHGGQNPLEPARFGNFIINGQHVDNFKEIYSFLKKNKKTIA